MGKEEKNIEKEIEYLLGQLMDKEGYEEVSKNPLHINTLASTTEQYLSPFITFGYDINGDAVVVSNAKTQQDIDSLMVSMGRYMSQVRMGDMNGDIGDIGDMLDE